MLPIQRPGYCVGKKGAGSGWGNDVQNDQGNGRAAVAKCRRGFAFIGLGRSGWINVAHSVSSHVITSRVQFRNVRRPREGWQAQTRLYHPGIRAV